mmetsp:Transcript_11647/g.45307  ORF Transcript_11647/g.45307 Transcript_11647/m.45307 type:complete len:209 (+) Transcript_11647:1076-1702(+)
MRKLRRQCSRMPSSDRSMLASWSTSRSRIQARTWGRMGRASCGSSCSLLQTKDSGLMPSTWGSVRPWSIGTRRQPGAGSATSARSRLSACLSALTMNMSNAATFCASSTLMRENPWPSIDPADGMNCWNEATFGKMPAVSALHACVGTPPSSARQITSGTSSTSLPLFRAGRTASTAPVRGTPMKPDWSSEQAATSRSHASPLSTPSL